jgi:hypothetical protein
MQVLPPVGQEFGDDLFHADPGLPVGSSAQLAIIADQERLIAGPQSGWIDLHIDRNAALAAHQFNDVGDQGGLTGAKIVNFTGPTVFEQQPERASDIAGMGEIAAGLQIADLDQRILPAGLDGRHLAAERLDRAAVALARPDVIEGARDQHMQAVALVVLQTTEFGGNFADAVGAGRAHGMIFAERHSFGCSKAILRTGTGDMNPRIGAAAPGGLKQIERPLNIDAHRSNWRIPGLAGITLGSQVINPVGTSAFKSAMDGKGILDIALVKDNLADEVRDRARIATPAFERMNFEIIESQQVIGQKATDRTGDPRNENAHAASFLVVRADEPEPRCGDERFAVLRNACKVNCKYPARLRSG